MASRYLAKLGLGFSVISFTLISQSCAQRDPMTPTPAINQTVSIMPIAVSPQMLALQHYDPMAGAAWQVTLQWSGQPIPAGDVELRFYKQQGSSPEVKILWQDLQAISRVSGCSAEQVQSLNKAPPGTVLICDSRLRISDYGLVEAVNRAGEKKTATSWGSWRVADDVMAAVINLL